MTALDDATRRRLQDHFSDSLVTIVGSGYSAALGLPGMGTLADELLAEMPARVAILDASTGTTTAADGWKLVANELADGSALEQALDKLEMESLLLPDIVAITARLIGDAEQLAIRDILGGKRLSLAEIIPHLMVGQCADIITTNYDRLIELAVELAGYQLECSFVGRHAAEFDPDRSAETMRNKAENKGGRVTIHRREHVRLSKPHGSLDWYRRNGSPFRSPYTVDLQRLMVTPGAPKLALGYERPFDYHREKANRAIDAAARYLTIGFGFNDNHLQTHLKGEVAAGKPLLMLTRELSAAAKTFLTLAGANVIALEMRPAGGTLLHIDGTTHDVPGSELWSLAGFIDGILT